MQNKKPFLSSACVVACEIYLYIYIFVVDNQIYIYSIEYEKVTKINDLLEQVWQQSPGCARMGLAHFRFGHLN